MPNDEYIYHIQLKNSNNELLYPITLWNLIQGRPVVQTQLTSANAGPGINIETTEGGVVHISADLAHLMPRMYLHTLTFNTSTTYYTLRFLANNNATISSFPSIQNIQDNSIARLIYGIGHVNNGTVVEVLSCGYRINDTMVLLTTRSSYGTTSMELPLENFSNIIDSVETWSMPI